MVQFDVDFFRNTKKEIQIVLHLRISKNFGFAMENPLKEFLYSLSTN